MKDFDLYIVLGFAHYIKSFVGYQDFWFIDRENQHESIMSSHW